MLNFLPALEVPAIPVLLCSTVVVSGPLHALESSATHMMWDTGKKKIARPMSSRWIHIHWHGQVGLCTAPCHGPVVTVGQDIFGGLLGSHRLPLPPSDNAFLRDERSKIQE